MEIERCLIEFRAGRENLSFVERMVAANTADVRRRTVPIRSRSNMFSHDVVAAIMMNQTSRCRVRDAMEENIQRCQRWTRPRVSSFHSTIRERTSGPFILVGTKIGL